MKKIALIILTGFLNWGLFSCTPDNIAEELGTPQACCGGEVPIPPPPPPPENGG